MALLDSLRSLIGMGSRYESMVYVGPTVTEVLGMDSDELFRTQPHLRTVVTFVSRNIAQLPIHTFVRAGDNDRRREHNDPVAKLLARPNPAMTQFELIYRTVADMKLHDVAIWMLAADADAPSGWSLWPIPINWVQATAGGTAWAPQWLHIIRPGSGKRFELENKPGQPPQFILFHGYDPSNPAGWSSPVNSLKEILAEQIQAWSYRQQVWQRGGRVGTYITRPVDAPEWSDEARTKFQRDWKAKWTGRDGTQAGGTPLFEDGMTLGHARFTAREEEWSEVAKLSLATVAGVYHTSPTMVGLLDNANYSNVREFKQMLYTDTLGPDLAMFEARINAFLVPWITENDDVYTEFNIAEKLQGSFEEQAAVISTSVGRPWMTADEARARFNMPALGGDAEQLVTPLNVIVGGLASPRDTAPDPSLVGFTPGASKMLAEVLALVPPEAGAGLIKALLEPRELPPGPKAGAVLSRASTDEPLKIKAETREEDVRKTEQVLKRFFARQRESVLAKVNGSKADSWWDEDRWNDELGADLYQLAMDVTSEVGADTLRQLGVDPEQYSPERTVEFLKAVAASRAGAINSTTRDQIKRALDGDVEDPDAELATPEGVFDQAVGSRLEAGAMTLATTLTGFAVGEAAHQLGRARTTKTWVVTSGNPRSSHALMDGETVGVDELFSNGAKWPGDAVLGADEVANCMCAVEITVP